jgi:hypothetical protein
MGLFLFGASATAWRREPFAGANGSLATNVYLAHLFLLRKTAALMFRVRLRSYLGAYAPAVRPSAAEPFAGANGSLATNVHLAHLFLLRKTAAFIHR